jgi:hypothetical protein
MRQLKAVPGPDGKRRKDRPDPVSGDTSPPSVTIAMTPTLKRGPAVCLLGDSQSGLEAVDEDAGRTEAGKFERR